MLRISVFIRAPWKPCPGGVCGRSDVEGADGPREGHCQGGGAPSSHLLLVEAPSIHVCTHIYTHAVRAHIHTCTHIYMHTCAHLHPKHTFTCTHMLSINIHVHRHTLVCTQTHTHALRHTVCKRACIHTYPTQVHTQASGPSCGSWSPAAPVLPPQLMMQEHWAWGNSAREHRRQGALREHGEPDPLSSVSAALLAQD